MSERPPEPGAERNRLAPGASEMRNLFAEGASETRDLFTEGASETRNLFAEGASETRSRLAEGASETRNLFVPAAGTEIAEVFDVLAESPAVRVERIVSTGHATPPGQWFDQDRDEWVVVLRGRARLRFEDADAPIPMGPGDHVTIAAHRRHRVEWTDPAEPTVWLAVHY